MKIGSKTGLDFEMMFFGSVVASFKKAPETAVSLFRQEAFLSAVKKVKSVQKSKFRWDPFHPRTALGNLLYLSVIENISETSLIHDLGFYVAVATELDYYGIDAFFMTKHVVVGIDVTVDTTEQRLFKKRLFAEQSEALGRPIVIVELQVLEREGGIDHYGRIIARHIEDLFHQRKQKKQIRRLKRQSEKIENESEQDQAVAFVEM